MSEPEFIVHPPCAQRVEQRRTGKLLGFCTRRVDHKGGCSTIIDDRTTHNVRVSNGITRYL